jgi:hypothetical protein
MIYIPKCIHLWYILNNPRCIYLYCIIPRVFIYECIPPFICIVYLLFLSPRVFINDVFSMCIYYLCSKIYLFMIYAPICIYLSFISRHVFKMYTSTNMYLWHMHSHTYLFVILCSKKRIYYLYSNSGMVVGFTTTHAISAYHHYSCEFKSCSGEVYSI